MIPIETEYNGYRFRSRLEARWAVAFDAMGIQYEYEPEGFVLNDGSKYLPDFRLLNVRHRSYIDEFDPLYVEVKGQMSPYDLKRIELFPEPIIVIGNIPHIMTEFCWERDSEKWYEWSFVFVDDDQYQGYFSKYKNEIWFCGPEHDEFDGGELMFIGISAAKKARFEHGQSGVT